MLLWLLVPLALLAALDAVASYQGAVRTARRIQERMLLGAARMIGEQVRVEDGVLQVIIPPAALELFASPSRDRVFYRATGSNEQLLAGYYDLPSPPTRPHTEGAVYFDAQIRGQSVHVVAYSSPVLSAPEHGVVLVEVAQTLRGLHALAMEIWIAGAVRQAGLLVLATLLLWFALRRGLQPVTRLRDTMLARTPGTIEKLDERAVPLELQPLVLAINDYAARLDKHMLAHSRFIADASHQLRTPLTVLYMQVSYAIRSKDSATWNEALLAIRGSVQHGIRLVQQLLTFSTAESGASRQRRDRVDLREVVTATLEGAAALAEDRHIDLGVQGDGGPVVVMGNRGLLQELVANLVDNALRYTRPGGQVTATVICAKDRVTLEVQDDGPGIPEAERQRVFERFYRLQNSVSDGCGLGLAIVREIAAGHGAEVSLHEPSSGRGVIARVRFPAASEAPDAEDGERFASPIDESRSIDHGGSGQVYEENRP